MSTEIMTALRKHRYPAVILVTGRDGEELPRSLLRLLGLTLLERALLSCQEAGVTECYVVVDHGRERIIPHIEELRRRHRISIQVVGDSHWQEESGTPFLAASPCLAGPFLLIPGDHLFDPDILRSLVESDTGSDVCLMAVDRRTDQTFLGQDATKVRVEGQAIIAIGKELPSFNAVATGLCLCRPALLDVLEKVRTKGGGSLYSGIRQLAEAGKVRAVDIGDRSWMAVDTVESMAYAKRILLASLSKPHEDGLVSRHLNRPLSLRISVLLTATPLTPNMITILSLLISLCGAFLFSLGDYFWTFLAGLLVQFASIVDGCDGEIARLKFQSSPFGAWLDTVLDRYADMAVAVGIAYGYGLTHPGPLPWLGGILALTGFVMFSYAKKEYHVRYGHSLRDPARYLAPASRDVRLFLLFLGALLNWPFQALLLAGLLAHLAVGLRFVTVYRREPPSQET